MPIFIGTRGDDAFGPFRDDKPDTDGLSIYAVGRGGDDDLNLGVYSDTSMSEAAATYRSVAYGGPGNDTLSAVLNIQSYYGGERLQNDDLLISLHGGGGSDRITAGYEMNLSVGPDSQVPVAIIELTGGRGNDRIEVQPLAPDLWAEPPNPVGPYVSVLEGNQGRDTLLGGDFTDELIGGQGNDFLSGRGGEDTFVFGSIRDGERDRVLDFTIGEDRIDISGIDAKSWRTGNQRFSFDESGEGGSGRVWVEDLGATTVVRADTGRDVLVVLLRDGWEVTAQDYAAGDFLL